MSDATEDHEPSELGVHVERLSVSRRGIGVNVEASPVHMHLGPERPPRRGLQAGAIGQPRLRMR